MESGSPESQAENPGAARRLLIFMAKANRSLDGKKDSRSKTPTRDTGGDWIAWMNPARSRSFPCFHAASRMVERRMCSLLWMGSADVPRRLSRLATVVPIRSPSSSLSSTTAFPGKANDVRMETSRPRLLGRVFQRGDPLPARLLLVDPGEEIVGRKVGESQQEVGQVPLRVHHDGGDVVDQRLLQETDAEPRLPAPRHPHADGMGDKIPGVVEDEVLLQRVLRKVEFAAQVEDSQLLEILHGPLLRGIQEKLYTKCRVSWAGTLLNILLEIGMSPGCPPLEGPR